MNSWWCFSGNSSGSFHTPELLNKSDSFCLTLQISVDVLFFYSLSILPPVCLPFSPSAVDGQLSLSQDSPHLDSRCCYCYTCTTHHPSFLPMHPSSPAAQVLPSQLYHILYLPPFLAVLFAALKIPQASICVLCWYMLLLNLTPCFVEKYTVQRVKHPFIWPSTFYFSLRRPLVRC